VKGKIFHAIGFIGKETNFGRGKINGTKEFYQKDN